MIDLHNWVAWPLTEVPGKGLQSLGIIADSSVSTISVGLEEVYGPPERSLSCDALQ